MKKDHGDIGEKLLKVLWALVMWVLPCEVFPVSFWWLFNYTAVCSYVVGIVYCVAFFSVHIACAAQIAFQIIRRQDCWKLEILAERYRYDGWAGIVTSIVQMLLSIPMFFASRVCSTIFFFSAVVALTLSMIVLNWERLFLSKTYNRLQRARARLEIARGIAEQKKNEAFVARGLAPMPFRSSADWAETSIAPRCVAARVARDELARLETELVELAIEEEKFVKVAELPRRAAA